MNSTPRYSKVAVWSGVAVVFAAIGLLGWVFASLNGLYDRVAVVSETLAAVVISILVLLLLTALGLGLRLTWASLRPSRRASPPKVATDPTQAAGQSIEAARIQLENVTDEIARRALSSELDGLSGDLAARRYTIVVFGTTSAGKTSVINALLGQAAGQADVLVGTTKQASEHTYTLEELTEGQLRLVDTPGLSEFGKAGLMREEQARDLATRADLLVFVVDQDLRDIELRPVASLAALGKRCIVVFNKIDLYQNEEIDAIESALRDRLKDIIDPLRLIRCAAAPAPVTIRDEAGSAGEETPASDVGELAEAIAHVLEGEGRSLLAQNILLQAHRVSESARDVIHQRRSVNAGKIVSRFQWTSAAVLFVNPVPGLGALAATAINYQMITEIGKIFGVAIDVASAKRMAGELAQILIKMGIVGVAADLLGKALKATIVGYVAGGAVEAVTGAYLTRMSGEAFIDYFAHDQDWGEGGMQRAIEKRFNLAGNNEFIESFVDEAARRVFNKTDSESGDAEPD